MLKSGELSTVKALVERYVQKVVISGEYIEIYFNLNVNSKIVTYSTDSTDVFAQQNKIPQFQCQQVTEVFDLEPTKMLDTRSAGGGT
ncbi:MAG: hypothetical protein FWD71_01805 [Oscillospiraceae bacterium]|nr:hypothetical protein [Oscillospiraceae bacterium]